MRYTLSMHVPYLRHVAIATIAAGSLLCILLLLTALPSLPSLVALSGSPIEALRLVIYFALVGIGDIGTRELVFMAVLPIVFGINVALLIEYRARYGSTMHVAPGLVGLVSAIAGAGCAACGTLLLAPLLATVGGLTLLTALPYGGEEVGWIGLVLLIISCALLWRGLRRPYG